MQANETRLVTKVRWIIEDINGCIKSQFRIFDGTIQNKMLLHIMDDLKIACALINCFYTRKLSDIEDSIEIAQEMKKNVSKKNELEKYFKKSAKNLFELLDTSTLNDFPKLPIEDIRKKITFGWYQINQALSYLAEHFDKNGDIEIRIEKKIEHEDNCKIIASNFFSRHSNNCEYMTVVKYMPNESILNWRCSCLSGLRTCGCCSHVASLIYYLSYARYLDEPLKSPGSSLNTLLVSLKKDEFSEDENNETSIIIQSNEESESTISNIDDEQLSFLSQIIDVSGKREQKIKRNVSINEQLNSSAKKKPLDMTLTSTQEFDKSQNSSESIKSSQLKNKYRADFINDISFREFTAHIPSWGGTIETHENDFLNDSEFYKYSEYKNLKFDNTCTIDYFLLAFWAISKISKNPLTKTLIDKSDKTSHFLKKILDLIDIQEWDRARTLWILTILELKPENWTFSLYGFQDEFFINYFLCFQELTFDCSICDTHETTKDFFFKKNNREEVFVYTKLEKLCKNCKQIIKGTFKNNPFCIFFVILDQIHFTSLPSSIHIDNKKFNLLCFTFESLHNNIKHFKSIFFLQNTFYLVDDLFPSRLTTKLPKSINISYCLYYLE